MEFQEVQNKLNNKYPNENITLICGTNSKKKCKIKCNTCGKVYTFNYLSSALKKDKKYLCKECGHHQQIKKRFEQSLRDKFPNEEVSILKFTTTQNECEIKCNKCGHVIKYKQAGSLLKRKHLCSKCYPLRNEELKTRYALFTQFIKDSDEWELCNEEMITKSSELIECKCQKCGQINKKTMYDYLRGIHCKCSRWDTKEKLEEILLNEGYHLLEQCTHSRHRVMIQHDECGFKYSINPGNFINGNNRCPKCKKNHSRGESIIKKYLEDNNIDYESEFPCLLEGHLLRFDFYIPDYDLYIEFQGRQHYMPVDFFGGEKALDKCKHYDNLKRQYCKNHNLLEIPYTEIDNIQFILNSKFNDYPEKEYSISIEEKEKL